MPRVLPRRVPSQPCGRSRTNVLGAPRSGASRRVTRGWRLNKAIFISTGHTTGRVDVAVDVRYD